MSGLPIAHAGFFMFMPVVVFVGWLGFTTVKERLAERKAKREATRPKPTRPRR